MSNARRFDTYEISPVVETITNPSVETSCQAFTTLVLAQLEVADFHRDKPEGIRWKRIMWTVYGHILGIAEAIDDFKTEQEALDFLYKVTGIDEQATGLQHIIRLTNDSKLPRFYGGDGGTVYDGATKLLTVMPPVAGIIDGKLLFDEFRPGQANALAGQVAWGLCLVHDITPQPVTLWLYTEDSDASNASKLFRDRKEAWKHLAEQVFQRWDGHEGAKEAFLAALDAGADDLHLTSLKTEFQGALGVDFYHVEEHTV